VLVSLWEVDDEATAELMRLFYREMLERGQAPAAALRSAQDALRRRPEWNAPYFWAGFSLQGDWRAAR
jgi:CHAT domain-containing protein